MKKRILTLLLAGLLAMSAIACNNPTENPNLTGGNGVDTAPIVTDEDGFQIVNETVYALVDELNLRTEASTVGDAAKKVDFATEMTRVKYGTRWSVVSYEGVEYYVMTDYITTDDLGLKTFTPLTTEKIMHATTSGVNVRLYPSSNTMIKDNLLKKLTLNETVAVIAESADWYQIKLDGKKYYVYAEYFEEGEVPSINDLGDYKTKFENGKLETPQTMYIINDSTRFRTLPSTEDYSEVITSYASGTPVTVIAVAKVNGSKWAKVEAPIKPDNPAAGTMEGYIRYDMLSLVKEADNKKLESLLAAYTFEEFDEEKTMYVAKDNTKGLNVRTSPSTTGNVKGSLPSEEEITVVAYGTGEFEGWYMIEYKDEGYFFVSAAYVTEEKGGKASLTSDSYKEYSELTAYAEPTKMVVKESGAIRFVAPELNDENQSGDALQAGAEVTVIAAGTYTKGTMNYKVFFVKDANGGYWFINQSCVQ